MLSSRLLGSCPLVLLVALASCDSKVTSTRNEAIEAQVKAVQKCIPGHARRLDGLLDLTQLWRLNGTNNPADPEGLEWSYAGDHLTYTLAVTRGADPKNHFVITGTIAFYLWDGAVFPPPQPPAPSLSQAIDDAATAMAEFANGPGGTLGPNGEAGFMVGEWTIGAEGVSSVGETSTPAAFTGIIRGSANGNELEVLSTTEGRDRVAVGPPPVQSCSIVAARNGETCTFTFRAEDIVTDGSPAQQYPIGTLAFSLTRNTATETVTVAGRFVMSDNVIATLFVDGVQGHFEINLDTFSIFHRP